MPNPFKYGGIVTGEDFADREKELKLLIKELTSGQNILLYSPRRYGKSSLMMMVLELLQKKGVMTAFIDVYGCVSLSDLIDKLIEETVVSAYGTMDKIVNFLKSALSGFRAEVTINPDGSLKISYRREIAAAGEKQVLPKVLDAPEKLAKAKNKSLVVVFDEFQEITNLNGTLLENLMRTHFQHHKHVTYVFMGSKRHLMEQMFGDANRPFYRFAKPFPLGKIPIEKFEIFIQKKFKQAKIAVDPSIIGLILAFTDGHPYFTQQLCHEVWNIASERGRVPESDIEEAIAAILRMHNDLFIRIWDSLTVPQKKLLIGISVEGNISSAYSSSFINKYELISPSHVERAIDPLLKDGTIEKANGAYALSDIFFKEWIKTKTAIARAKSNSSLSS